jgi:hypothetical protein
MKFTKTCIKKLLLCGAEIDLKASNLVFQDDFSSNTIDAGNWIPNGSSVWQIRSGALEGKWDSSGKELHGQLFTRQTFPGDVLLEFTAQTVLPSDHDIIWWWQTELNETETGWQCGSLGCLGGWWKNKAGIERLTPEAAWTTTTPLFPLEAGRMYRIHSGNVGKIAFIFVDGHLVMESEVPQAVSPEKALRIGFGVYQSHIRIGGLRVYKPSWRTVVTSY